MKVAEVLFVAADEVESEGLWQSTDPESTGTCAGNAIWKASGKVSELAEAARWVLVESLGLSVVPSMWAALSAIYNWNDEPGRTQAEVVGALRTAGVVAEAAEIVAGAEAQRVAVFEVTR